MKDYPPLPDGLPRILSASSALASWPDSVCRVLDAPELKELAPAPDGWIAGRLRRLPLCNEDNEPRRIRDLSAGCCWPMVLPQWLKQGLLCWAAARPACR